MLHGPHALYRLYPARAGWVFLDASEDRAWQALCSVLGADLAQDARFASEEARRAHDAELVEVLAARFATRAADEWEQSLIPLDVGCVRADVDPGRFLSSDEHVLANGFAPEVTHAMWDTHTRWAPTTRFSETPERPGPGVLAGRHTDTILAELGYDAQDIERLREAKVVWSEPVLDPRTLGAG
jgi:crotonobetainyl-CoA:carnitine CoA-transferase CaiB-like acyl-CoA transferase